MTEGTPRPPGTGSGSEADAQVLIEAQRATRPAAADYRRRLRPGGHVIDVETWAGSLPESYGIAPRIRIGRSRWFNLLWLLPIGLLVLLALVATARGIRTLPAVQQFIDRYPGTVPTGTVDQASGFPLWVAAQHFLNLFLMIFIIRSGWQILADHPRLY
jgi:methionine sulfoxide reductase catalytic subunit